MTSQETSSSDRDRFYLGEDGGVRTPMSARRQLSKMSTRRQLSKMSTCRQLHKMSTRRQLNEMSTRRQLNEMSWGRNVDAPTIALLAEAVSRCQRKVLFHVEQNHKILVSRETEFVRTRLSFERRRHSNGRVIRMRRSFERQAQRVSEWRESKLLARRKQRVQLICDS